MAPLDYFLNGKIKDIKTTYQILPDILTRKVGPSTVGHLMSGGS